MSLPQHTVDVPKRLVEPARRVGNFVLAIAAAIGVVLAAVTPLADFVPGEWHGPVATAFVTAGVVVGVVTRVATELVRGKVTPFSPDLAERYRQAARTAQAEPRG